MRPKARAHAASRTDKATIRDVARIAGVSLATASRAINGHRSVSPSVRQRVADAVSELGYKPDATAQNMRTGVTRTIGIIVRSITVPALAGFVESAQRVLDNAGYALIIMCSEDRRERELELLGLMARRRVDGLIMTTQSETDPELIAARASLECPIVLLDRESTGDEDATTVDHCDGVRRAIDYLFDLGHQRIALVTGTTAVYPSRDRARGYREAHERHGIPIDPELVRTDGFDMHSAFSAVSALLGSPRRPTAIVAGGINMLGTIMQAVRSRGLRIPEDVSIIGASDTDLSRLATPPITVIRWNFAELGETAARLLLDRLLHNPKRAGRRLNFPTELVVRSSCSAQT
jgi:LacI family transcriptional regulator